MTVSSECWANISNHSKASHLKQIAVNSPVKSFFYLVHVFPATLHTAQTRSAKRDRLKMRLRSIWMLAMLSLALPTSQLSMARWNTDQAHSSQSLPSDECTEAGIDIAVMAVRDQATVSREEFLTEFPKSRLFKAPWAVPAGDSTPPSNRPKKPNYGLIHHLRFFQLVSERLEAFKVHHPDAVSRSTRPIGRNPFWLLLRPKCEFTLLDAGL